MFNTVIKGVAKGLISFTNDYSVVEDIELANLKLSRSQLEDSKREIADLRKVSEERDTNFDSQISERYATIVELEDKLRRVTDERDTARENINKLIEEIRDASRVPKKLKEDIENKYLLK